MGDRHQIPHQVTKIQHQSGYIDQPVLLQLSRDWFDLFDETTPLHDHPSFIQWYTELDPPLFVVARIRPLIFSPVPQALLNGCFTHWEQRLYTAVTHHRAHCHYLIGQYINAIVLEANGSSVPPTDSTYHYIESYLLCLAGLSYPPQVELRATVAVLTCIWNHQE